MAKRLISILLCFVLCSASTISAFADNGEITGEEDSSSPVYNANFEDMKSKTLDNAAETKALVKDTLIKLGDTKATDYAKSIYNAFFNSSSGIFGGSSTSWGSISVTRLGNINSKCGDIKNICNSINTNILNIMDMINTDYNNSDSPLYHVSLQDVINTSFNNLIDNLTYVDANDDFLSIAEYLLVIDNNIDATRSAILTYLSLIDSSTSTINTDIHTYIKPDISNILNKLNILISLYGTNEYEDVKEAQSDYESDVLTGFTGSGSASASRSDISNIKNASGALKQGLNTGVDYSYAFSSLDDDSGLYVWFSQSVADYFTLSSSNSRNAIKFSENLNNVVWSDSIPDYLSHYNNKVDEVINSGKSYK